MPHLFVGCLRHAAADCRLQNASLILYGRALKDMIAGVGNGLSFSLLFGFVRAGCMNLCMFARLGYNAIRLMAVLCGQFAVPLQYFFRGMNLLAVPRAMGSNLRRACAFSSNLLQVSLDLFSPWTGCIQDIPACSL